MILFRRSFVLDAFWRSNGQGREPARVRQGPIGLVEKVSTLVTNTSTAQVIHTLVLYLICLVVFCL